MKVNKAAKGLSTVDAPAPKEPDADDWEAHNHYDTLMRAEQIKSDPAKMEKVRKIAGAKLEAAHAINSISDIKMAAKKMRKAKGEMA